MMSQHIVIRTDAGEVHGMGHAVRMKALAEALTERGASVGFVTTTEDTLHVVDPFPCMVNRGDFGSTMGISVLVIDTKAQDWANDAWRLFSLRKAEMSVVLIDSEPLLSAVCDLAVSVSPHALLRQLPSPIHALTAQHLNGWPYVILSQEARGQKRLAPFPGPLADSVVFCAGGTDVDQSLDMMYDWSSTLLPGHDLLFLYGALALWPAPALYEQQQQFFGGDPWLRYAYPFDRQLCCQAGLVVGFMGVTMYECLYWGTPMLAFARTEEDAACLDALAADYPTRVRAGGVFATLTADRFQALVRGTWDMLSGTHPPPIEGFDGRGADRIAEAILALGEGE